MAVTWQSVALTSVGNVAAVAATKPTGVANGDLLVAVAIAQNKTGPPTWTGPGAGWTEVIDSQGDALYWHAVTNAGGEPATYTFTCSNANGAKGVAVSRFSGADQTTPMGGTPVVGTNIGAATMATVPAMTTTVADALVSMVIGNSSSDTIIPPAGTTERYDANATAPTHYTGGDRVQAVAGSTGTTVWTDASITATFEAVVFAIAAVMLIASPTGIPSVEAFGTPAAVLTYTATPTGIASSEGFGSPTATLTYTATPTGIASGESFGTPTASGSLLASPAGIASSEAFGAPTAVLTYTASPESIPSDEGFGSPTAVLAYTATPVGIESAEAFGVPTALWPPPPPFVADPRVVLVLPAAALAIAAPSTGLDLS